MGYYARPTCHLVLVWVTFEIQVTEILARIAGTKRPHPLTSASINEVFARSALYFLCVRGPARTLVCLVVVTDFVKFTLSSGRVTTLLPLGVLTEISKYCVFSLFLDPFHQRLTLHICGLRVPKMGTFHCFWISFISDLGFISGLVGPEKGSVLTSGASRPCSAECCLVSRGFQGNSLQFATGI